MWVILEDNNLIYKISIMITSTSLKCCKYKMSKSAQIGGCCRGLQAGDLAQDSFSRHLRTQEAAGHARRTHFTFVGLSDSHPELEWPWLQGPEGCICLLGIAIPRSTFLKHWNECLGHPKGLNFLWTPVPYFHCSCPCSSGPCNIQALDPGASGTQIAFLRLKYWDDWPLNLGTAHWGKAKVNKTKLSRGQSWKHYS